MDMWHTVSVDRVCAGCVQHVCMLACGHAHGSGGKTYGMPRLIVCLAPLFALMTAHSTGLWGGL